MDDIAGQMSLFENLPEEEKPVELIEPEIVEQPKKPRKKKPTLAEQFKDIPTRQVTVNTLSDEDKICPLCGSEMLAIGTEVIRSEVVYTPPKLERIGNKSVRHSKMCGYLPKKWKEEAALVGTVKSFSQILS